MKNNIFVKFLINNGWKELSPMSYGNIFCENYQLFFDTSNQIELYFKERRIDECYLKSIADLEQFLNKNNPFITKLKE